MGRRDIDKLTKTHGPSSSLQQIW